MAVFMTAIFISVPTLAQQNREADQLVKGMIEASKTLNYSGLVTGRTFKNVQNASSHSRK